MARVLSGEEYVALQERHVRSMKAYIWLMKRNTSLSGEEIHVIRELLTVQQDLIDAERAFKEAATVGRSTLVSVAERN